MRVLRSRRRAAAALGVLALSTAVATGGATPTASAAPARTAAKTVHPPAAATKAAPKAAPTAAPRTHSAKPAIAAGDEVVTGRGDLDGYHVFGASAAAGWSWQPLATLRPGGGDEERWIGEQCLTGDGRYVVAVVAPWSANNVPGGLDRGGTAYVIDAHDGAVRALTSGVSVYYHDPGCGADGQVVLSRYLGKDQQATELLTFDTATGALVADQQAQGQVTSAVPVGGAVYAARGSRAVRLRSGRETTVASVGAPVAELRPNAVGGVDFVSQDQRAGTSRVWRIAAGTATPVAEGAGNLASVHLFQGRAGHTVVTGLAHPGADLRQGPTTAGQATAASLDGTVLALEGTAPATVDDRSPLGTVPLTSAAGVLPQPDAPVTTAVPASPTKGTAAATATARTTAAAATTQAGTASTPTCAVPRNNPAYQVPQPTPAQVVWAVNHLTADDGVVSRPAGALNLGLPAYSPGTDFAAAPLRGGGAVPREVVEAILAQESNWNQASPHALPGVPGNPYVSDYYGFASQGPNGTSVDPGSNAPDYAFADCGYGIAQITDGMRFSAGQTIPTALQTKVAVDYAENIAASIKILADKWNQLYAAGVTVNGGDATRLESWYFAVWAYNTGVDPQASTGNTSGCTPGPSCTDSAGNWGLGWTNNPQNPNWQVGRMPFLQTSYADAATPQRWPYQEKVLGWMQYPQKDDAGQAKYQNSNPLSLPSDSAFCDASDNCNTTDNPQCDSNGLNCQNPGAFCGYGHLAAGDPLAFHCWWHSAASFCSFVGCTSGLAESVPTTEPSAVNPYPPACQASSPVDQAGTIIVDNQSPDLNLAGCSQETWTSQGKFTTSFGYPAGSGDDWDFHQLGVGFGGHMYFTHSEQTPDNQTVTGTWKANGITTGAYQVYAFVPDNGAAAKAYYQVGDGVGTTYDMFQTTNADGSATTWPVDQSLYSNQWVPIGAYWLHPGASVQLSNLTPNDPAGVDLGYGAVAFVPVATSAPKCTPDAPLGTTGSCVSLDPTAENCSQPGTVTLSQVLLPNATLDVRYSPICHTDWIRMAQAPSDGKQVIAQLLSSASPGTAPILSPAQLATATAAHSTMIRANQYVWLCAGASQCGLSEHMESSGKIDDAAVWNPVCTDTTCQNAYPFATPSSTAWFPGGYEGCGADAQQIGSTVHALPTQVSLFYSPSCHAAWAEGELPAGLGGGSQEGISIQTTTKSPPDNTFDPSPPTDPSGVYTPMVGTKTENVRVCGQPAGYSGDQSTWMCSPWQKLS